VDKARFTGKIPPAIGIPRPFAGISWICLRKIFYFITRHPERRLGGIMSKVPSIVCVILVIALFLVPAFAQSEQQQPQMGKLNVRVSYLGTEGAVNDTHAILVFVFDSPDFMQGTVMPLRFSRITENGGTAEFELAESPVFLAMLYDKEGGYDLSGPPASGSPASLYTKEPPAPAPLEIPPGTTVEVQLEFDDSFRVP
jgi:hypothetical protein